METTNTQKLAILVVDDSAVHRAAAQSQISDHDLVVVGTYEEALTLIEGNRWNICRREKAAPRHFDVVMVDLLMPAPGLDRTEKRIGEEMPVGIFLGLLAAKRGAKALVFTDSDHHAHPASACFDSFNEFDETNPVAFPVGMGALTLSNNRRWVDGRNYGDTVRVKNWAAALTHILDPVVKE